MKFEEKNCRSCRNLQSCEDIYRKLGQSDSPPVTTRIILALLMPLVIFIAFLAFFNWFLSRVTGLETLAVILSLFAAFCVTFIYVLKVSGIGNKNKKLIIEENRNEQFDN